MAELPALLGELEVVVARQARVGNAPRRVPAAVGDDWHFRSLEGIALPQTPWPFHPDAAHLRDLAVNAVQTWARHVAESRGIELTAGGSSVAAVCAWLTVHIDAVRLDEAAGQMHRRLTKLARRLEAAVDRHDPDVFAGRCTATTVTTHVADGTIVPEIAECGAELYANLDATVVDCPDCGAEYNIAERYDEMLKQIPDHLGTVRQVAGVLRTQGLDVTVDKINGWRARGRIASHGADTNGHILVRVGEVHEFALAEARRAAARRKIVLA